MTRRDFLTSASASALLPFSLDGLNLKALSKNSALVKSILKTNVLEQDRILVIIYLNGGNDGLNTVIPLDFYPEYLKLRSNIAIPESKALKLPGYPETAFHPAMTAMRDMFADGTLSIVHSVSYPNPDLSHFRSSDIWMTGVDANQYEKTGWAGRYLDSRFPGFPDNYPNPDMTDPLALQIGYVSSTTLLGKQQPMNVTLQDPESFYRLVGQMGAFPIVGFALL